MSVINNIIKMNKKKIVLLDLGGVVFQMSGKSSETISWEIIWKLNNKYGSQMDLGGTGFSDFLIEYNNILGQNLSSVDFLQGVFDTLDYNEELIKFLQKDREIIIVSDNYRENIEYISKRYHFESWAIKQIYSYEYKMHKSNPNFFAKLLEDIGEYDKEGMILIDDSESKLESALKNGIKGILYKNNQQVMADIER